MPGNRDDDNLVQLPIGARFGLDHEPTPQEREDLVRFAAAADAELRRPARDERGRAQDEAGEPRPVEAEKEVQE
jgi:hypothetical protein